jgi:hypothetical protein
MPTGLMLQLRVLCSSGLPFSSSLGLDTPKLSVQHFPWLFTTR